jgi:L,D-transpeptidase YcbB
MIAAGAVTGLMLSAAVSAWAQTAGTDPIAAVPAPAPSVPVPAMPETPVSTEFLDQLDTWSRTLDARATALDAAPQAPVTRIGPGELLKKWSVGDRVGRLSARLTELGLLQYRKGRSLEFDEAVETAVRKFQAEQGIRPDGLVGASTQQALDRSPAQRATVIRAAATAMRELQAESLPDVLLVNLPSQTVRLVRNGKAVLTMRAVVGRPERSTPLLRDEVTHVIVNPTWTVPPTVLKEDKLPNLRNTGKPGINNATIFLDGQAVPAPERVDWANVTPGRVRIVQDPGDGNALGRFRFNLTNPYNIYLHGTNEPKLFDRELRTISSGCVRLQDARRMAEEVLGSEGIDVQQIDRLLSRGKPQWVKLSKPIPVRFTYWMATVDETNRVRMHPDIYSIEERPVPAIPAAAPPASKPASPSPA